MKKTTKSVNYFTVDFFNKKIIGTKASFNKASKGSGSAYDELVEKINNHPEFELVIKEQNKHTTRAKRTYFGLDFDFIEAYIETRNNFSALNEDYKAVKKMAKDSGISVYPTVKKWFLGEFDPDDLGFDMEQAKKEISDYRISKAILSTSIVNEDEDQANDLAKAG